MTQAGQTGTAAGDDAAGQSAAWLLGQGSGGLLSPLNSHSNPPPYADQPLPDDHPAVLRHLVLSYLAYHCYQKTAETFANGIAFGISSDSKSKSASDLAAGKGEGESGSVLSLFQPQPHRQSMDLDEPPVDRATASQKQPQQSASLNALEDHGLVELLKTMQTRKCNRSIELCV